MKNLTNSVKSLSRVDMKNIIGGKFAEGYTCWCDGNSTKTTQISDANDTIGWGEKNCVNTYECVHN